jgi:hypothetical protein
MHLIGVRGEKNKQSFEFGPQLSQGDGVEE